MTKPAVVVVGGGNAGLCAAAAALEAGASVTLVEKASRAERGGNTRFTVCYAFPYGGLGDLARLSPDIMEIADRAEIRPYTADDFLRDLISQSEGRADPELMRLMVDRSLDTMNWLTRKGLTWRTSLEGAWEIDGRLHFQDTQVIRPERGGASIVATLFDHLERYGADVRYATSVTGLLTDGTGAVSGVDIDGPGGPGRVPADSVVLAAGGFEASAERRVRHLGPQWRHVKVRGVRHNTGECLDMALALGADRAGEWDGCHATQVHASADDYEIGDRAFPHAYPFSVLLNREGRRFVDEGRDFQPYTYATLGRAVLAQTDAIAYQIFDAKTVRHRRLALIGDVYAVPHATASTLAELAGQLEIEDVATFTNTIEEFNAHVVDGHFDPSRLDGKRTAGLAIDKSNWAVPIDTPPFEAYPVTCGITFTYGGLRFSSRGEVLDTNGNPIPGLYVAGEMAGTMARNYVGCSGLTKGAVFGRIAGAQAATRTA